MLELLSDCEQSTMSLSDTYLILSTASGDCYRTGLYILQAVLNGLGYRVIVLDGMDLAQFNQYMSDALCVGFVLSGLMKPSFDQFRVMVESVDGDKPLFICGGGVTASFLANLQLVYSGPIVGNRRSLLLVESIINVF